MQEVHLLVMVLALWLSNTLDQVRQKQISFNFAIAELMIVGLLLTICLWQAGYFSLGAGSGAAGGYGTFRLNLLALIDSRGWSYILPPIPMQIDFGNGFNYLGLGVIIAIPFAVFALFSLRKTLFVNFKF